MNIRKLKRKKKKIKAASYSGSGAPKFYEQGLVLKRTGRLQDACAAFRKAIKKDPELIHARIALSDTLCDLELLDEGFASYEEACQSFPADSYPFYCFGVALIRFERYKDAELILKKALQVEPDNVDVMTRLGEAYNGQDCFTEALSIMERALAADPKHLEAHRDLGKVFLKKGDIDIALSKFRDVLALRKNDPHCLYMLSRYNTYTEADHEDIGAIHNALNRGGLGNEECALLHFALGKIYDELALYSKAFDHYKKGNQCRLTQYGTGRITTGLELSGIIKVFTKELFQRFEGFGSSSDFPVFIVGMPRSGTTLVEQICASHSRVHGAGELQKITGLVERLPSLAGGTPYPECMTVLPPESIGEIADQYVEGLVDALPGDIQRVTDKLPGNFIKLGLIRIFFPKARIIHCRRDPVDTCLSNYFQNFADGHEYSFDLSALGLFYRKYEELMRYWKKELPGGKIHEVHYEKLVTNFSVEAGKIINFLGLSWEEKCLSFYTTKRVVHTSSDFQVRQPIYSKSVHRWKNYQPYIQDLLDALAGTSILL